MSRRKPTTKPIPAMTRSRFLAMTPQEFSDWVRYDRRRDGSVYAFFEALRWVEGFMYCLSERYAMLTAYRCLQRHRHNWPAELLDTED